VAALALLLVVVSFVVFSLVHVAPGSPEQVLLGTRPSTPETRAALRERYHLDDPFLVQYGAWLGHAVRLDFGDSVQTGRPVADMIGERWAITVVLAAYAFVLALLAGVPLGVLAAARRRGAVDRAVVGVSVVGASAPVFVTAVALLWVFAVTLGWFPTFGAGDGVGDRLWHLTLPALALALSATAIVVKLTRASVIGALGQEHVAFARARGVPPGRLLVGHVLRTALVPVVTAGGLVLTVTITGAVLAEQAFALPGLGSMLIDAVGQEDVPVLQGVAVLLALLVVVVNLVVDVLYALVDPRIAFGAGRR
jgi:peptide/nickel transport system permease protein